MSAEPAGAPLLLGCDFSSRPTRRKPVVLAWGRWDQGLLRLVGTQTLCSLNDYAQWARLPGAWVGGFDMPFGLPRTLVECLGWPLEWEACIRHYAALDRAHIRELFKAFCEARPVGGKFAHRATDGPAGSSPSMKWVNPPVAWMLHAGVLPLLDGGVFIPGLQPAPADGASPAGGLRVALEAYPGLLARGVLGRSSYKSDDPATQTPARQRCRARLVEALESGALAPGIAVRLSAAQRELLVEDARGDSLDAVLCLVQAAWAWLQGPPWYGLPPGLDRLEGWITGAPWPQAGD